MRRHQIEEIGKWTLRVVLVIGLIVAAMYGKREAAILCFFGLIFSEALLD